MRSPSGISFANRLPLTISEVYSMYTQQEQSSGADPMIYIDSHPPQSDNPGTVRALT